MKRRYWQQQMCIKISHGYLRKSIETLNVLWKYERYCCTWSSSITNRYCNHPAIECNLYRRLFIIAFYVPTLNRCPTIYERCLDLSAYLKLSGAPGTWLLRLHLVYIQTSGSSDMPYMICDVLVVFLERHVLSYVLSLFSNSRIAFALLISLVFMPVSRRYFYYPYQSHFSYCALLVKCSLNWLYRIQSRTSLVK